MESIITSTQQYESRLANETGVINEDLDIKHQRMAEDAFSFFRAAYYRWIEWYHGKFHDVSAPSVFSVGDLHVENFGTWRDSEGRLVWGVNDLDEAARLPFDQDILRLAASAILAVRESMLSAGEEEACASILEGYRTVMLSDPDIYILEERHGWLREMTISSQREPAVYWEKMEALKPVTPVPETVMGLLQSMVPEAAINRKVVHRLAGLGSLGRPRFALVADLHGSKMAREVKAIVRSAADRFYPEACSQEERYLRFIQSPFRPADPFLKVFPGWIHRRLSPDCSRIDLSSLPSKKDALRLVKAMGKETANMHRIDPAAVAPIRAFLPQLCEKGLYRSAETLANRLTEDWQAWRKHYKKSVLSKTEK